MWWTVFVVVLAVVFIVARTCQVWLDQETERLQEQRDYWDQVLRECP